MQRFDAHPTRGVFPGAVIVALIISGTSSAEVAITSTASIERVEHDSTPRASRTSTSGLDSSMSDEERALFSEERESKTPTVDDPLLVLKLPATLTELAFAPLIPVLLSLEELRLHDRVFDLLTNDERTIAFVPLLEIVNRSGFSAGAAFIRNDPLGSPDRLVAYALMRTNRDRAASLSYTRRVPALSGRKLHVGAAYNLDRDARYFGINASSRKSDERLIESEAVDVVTWLEVPAPVEWTARIALAYRRRSLDTGEGPEPGLLLADSVAPPVGFGRALDYPEVGLKLEYDSRDSSGRTTLGIIAALEGIFTHDLNGARAGGAHATAKLATFLPLLPLNRVLVLAVGMSVAAPLGRGREVPLQTLVSLGGSDRLRGYVSDRFVERLGWWATAEYRYKIFEYGDTGNGLSATIFTDVGRVGREIESLLGGPIRYSIGLGLRAEANLFFLARLQLAYSPEGIRLVIAVNEIL